MCEEDWTPYRSLNCLGRDFCIDIDIGALRYHTKKRTEKNERKLNERGPCIANLKLTEI